MAWVDANFRWPGRFAGKTCGDVERRWLKSVGVKLFGDLVPARWQAGLLGALNLGHSAVVDDQLYDAVAQALHFFPNKRDPVG